MTHAPHLRVFLKTGHPDGESSFSPSKPWKNCYLVVSIPHFPHFPMDNWVNPLFSGTIQPSKHQDFRALTAQDGLLLNLGREAPNAVTRTRFLTDENGDVSSAAVQQPKMGDWATTSVVSHFFFWWTWNPNTWNPNIYKFQDLFIILI